MGKGVTPRLTPPNPIKTSHDTADFDCGEASLNDWLQKRAFGVEGDTARTYVVCRGRRVVGYDTIAAGAVDRAAAPGALRRNAPNPIPVMVLARLAVDRSEKGKGLGRDLLADATKRVLKAAGIVGARALLVDAIDERRAEFYERHGFRRLAPGGLTLFVPLRTVLGGL